jgi:MFS family permease
MKHVAQSPGTWRVVVTGMVALAAAMGIGRFAFTPLLPMMLADGVVDIATASWLASANYLGYLLGALLCTFQPWLWRRLGIAVPVSSPALVMGGLVATAVVTLGMALQWPEAWPALRFVAGVASAFVFIHTSSWCLTRLSRLGVPALGALVYAGPGGGIVLTGLAATVMVAWHGSATLGWLIFGGFAALLTVAVWPVLAIRDGAVAAQQAGSAAASEGPAPHGPEVAMLATAYGLAGFGYIITATFLPVIARQSLKESAWLDMFWPILGAGVIVGVLIASRLRGQGDQRLRLAACYLVQALGIAAGVWSPTLVGFAIGSLLLGLPFTAITFFALQEVRRMRPAAPAGLMGLITAMYGLGQIVGPPLAAALVARSTHPAEGFALSLGIAAGALVLGALIYFAMARLYPQVHEPRLRARG